MHEAEQYIVESFHKQFHELLYKLKPCWAKNVIAIQGSMVSSTVWDLLPDATKLGQGNVFTGVCDSVHRGVSASVHAGIPPPPPHPD